LCVIKLSIVAPFSSVLCDEGCFTLSLFWMSLWWMLESQKTYFFIYFKGIDCKCLKFLKHLNVANIWEKKIIIRPVWLASRFKRAVLRRKSTQILDKLGCFTKIFFVNKWYSLMPRVSPKFIEVNCGIKNISLWPVF